MSMYDKQKESVKKIYKENSKEVISTLISKHILYEFEYGLGSPQIEYATDTLNELLIKDGYDFDLDFGCHLNDGDTLYYIYANKYISLEDAKRLAKKQYEKNRREIIQ